MSKITFRADDDLVAAVEGLDASKSEVMRDALRSYLENAETSEAATGAIDDVVADRVDELVDRRGGGQRGPERDVNIHVTVEPGEGFRPVDQREPDREQGPRGERRGRKERSRGRSHGRDGGRHASDESGTSCSQCGESVSDDHVYCPNCGEKATRRVFCECGDEVRADWSFCPHCGRRTASADALDG